MEIKNIEECRQYVRERLKDLRPIFAKAAIGDFSSDVPMSEIEDDEMAELIVGIQTMLEVVRAKVADLEQEIGQREETEKRLIEKNRELAMAHRAMVNVMSDLQESKEEIEQEEAKYEALLNSVGHGVMAVDRDGKVIYMNVLAENALGWNAQEVTGHKLTDSIILEDSDGKPVSYENRPMIQAIQSGKTISSSDYFYQRKDGTKFPVVLTVSPIILGTKIIGGIETFRDITQDK